MASGTSKSGWFDEEPEFEDASWLAAEPDDEWVSGSEAELTEPEDDATGEGDVGLEEGAEDEWEWEWEWEWVEEPVEEADEPRWAPGGPEAAFPEAGFGGPQATPPTPGPAPGGPPPASGAGRPPGGSAGARGGAAGGAPSGEPLAAPGQERSAEEEREVVTDFAMQQLAESRGQAAAVPLGGGTDRSPEEMRDQALQEYLRKKEELERERAEKAERNRRAAEKAAAECAAALEEVKGLKPATQERILEHYSSVQALQSASVEELTEIEGVGKTTAERIREAVGG